MLEKKYNEAETMVYMNTNMKIEAKMKENLLKSQGRELFAVETQFMSKFQSVDGKAKDIFGGNAPELIKAVGNAPELSGVLKTLSKR